MSVFYIAYVYILSLFTVCLQKPRYNVAAWKGLNVLYLMQLPYILKEDSKLLGPQQSLRTSVHNRKREVSCMIAKMKEILAEGCQKLYFDFSDRNRAKKDAYQICGIVDG